MAAGNSNILEPLQRPEFAGSSAGPGTALPFVIASPLGGEPGFRGGDAQPIRATVTQATAPQATRAHAKTLPFVQPRNAGRAIQHDPATLAWLWRSTNLTTVAAGCGIALALHTADSYFFSESMPVVIAGSAPHLFPPLCALLVCAFLAVMSQRSKREGARFYETVAERFMLLTTSFAVAWTAIEWALRLLGLSAGTRSALPLEALFSAVAVLFYAMAWGKAGQRLPWGEAARDVLIVGTDATARDVKEYLQTLPRCGYRFRGFISTADGTDWSFAAQGEVAGHVDDLVAAARSMFVDEVIVAATPSLRKMEDLCAQARCHQITLRFVPSVSECLRRAGEVRYIGNLPTIVAYQRAQRPVSQTLKRALDLGLGCVALVMLSPVFLAIALAIKRQSDGPVFYRSERVGVRGRGFLCYKFRTMVRNADELRSSVAHLNERKDILFKISNDPRVTPLGAWLRKYSLDELPQLLNVLRGDMSLVGPRPSLRAEVMQYGPAHYRRLDVVPGMTGLWQVEARTDPSFESYVTLDCRYADEWSMGLDLKILMRTLRVVFLGTGV